METEVVRCATEQQPTKKTYTFVKVAYLIMTGTTCEQQKTLALPLTSSRTVWRLDNLETHTLLVTTWEHTHSLYLLWKYWHHTRTQVIHRTLAAKAKLKHIAFASSLLSAAIIYMICQCTRQLFRWYLLIVSPWPPCVLQIKLKSGLKRGIWKASTELVGSTLAPWLVPGGSTFFALSITSSAAVKQGKSSSVWKICTNAQVCISRPH